MRSIRSLAVVVAFAFTSVAVAESPQAADPAPAKKEQSKKVEKCELHGVTKVLCARCNPKLEAAFKAKNDWCAEHSRPESQCVLCNPELAKQGIK